jgi:transposase
VHEMAADIERLNLRIAQIEREVADLLEHHGNPVADLHGAGATIASALIAQAGDVRRFRSPAAFARYSGTAPIPCGSGQSAGRHRLHRGGNRQLNAALHRIAITQLQRPGPGHTYLDHRRAADDTKREAIRALRRRISDEVYRRLRVDELARQRQPAGLVVAA